MKVTMKALRVCIFLIALLTCSRGALACQSNTPEAALEEMVTTDKLEVVLKHYPLIVQEAVEKLGPKEKEQISGKLLLRKQIEKDEVTFHKKDDGTAWEVVDKKEGVVGSIKLKNTFVSGTEAFLVLEARGNQGFRRFRRRRVRSKGRESAAALNVGAGFNALTGRGVASDRIWSLEIREPGI